MARHTQLVPFRFATFALAVGALFVASSCASPEGETAAGAADQDAVSAQTASTNDDLGAVGTLASSEVHTIDVEFDADDYTAMVEAYVSTDEKEWIEATVTIDGERFEQVGLRLKGNSSLRGVTLDADPSALPWLIRLDKYIDDQSLDGLTDLVVRSNNTTSALNEAVALELLSLAGLASQDAIGVAFSVNDSEPSYRLVIEHPDDTWLTEAFDDPGALYKAESTGDYNYRGDDPEAYDEFPAVPGDGAAPFEDGDIGGRGIRPDGAFPGGGGSGVGGGGPAGSNILVDRCLANSDWSSLEETRADELRAARYDSGTADAVLDTWREIVTASGLVGSAVVEADAAQTSTHFCPGGVCDAGPHGWSSGR
jgi:spore coat protein CotH